MLHWPKLECIPIRARHRSSLEHWFFTNRVQCNGFHIHKYPRGWRSSSLSCSTSCFVLSLGIRKWWRCWLGSSQCRKRLCRTRLRLTCTLGSMCMCKGRILDTVLIRCLRHKPGMDSLDKGFMMCTLGSGTNRCSWTQISLCECGHRCLGLDLEL